MPRYTEFVTSQRASVVSTLALPIVGELSRRGLDASELLTSLGLSAGALEAKDARIGHDRWLQLLDGAVALSGDPAVTLHAAHRLHDGSLDVTGYLVRAQQTIGEGYAAYTRYFRLAHDGLRVEVEDDGETARCYLEAEPGVEITDALGDFMLANMCEFSRRLVRGAPGPDIVRLTRVQPADRAPWDGFFDAEVHFGAVRAELQFPLAAFDLPMSQADRGLSSLLEDTARQHLDALAPHERVAVRLQSLLRQRLADGQLGVAQLARELGMSESTLRRRLREEGTTHTQILDALRRELALQYAGRGLSATDVSLRLGYSEASAFQRAFKRWTGKPFSAARGASGDRDRVRER